jgi:hypothetical protein
MAGMIRIPIHVNALIIYVEGCSLNIWSKKRRNISQIFKVGIEETQVDEINLR